MFSLTTKLVLEEITAAVSTVHDNSGLKISTKRSLSFQQETIPIVTPSPQKTSTELPQAHLDVHASTLLPESSFSEKNVEPSPSKKLKNIIESE